MSGRSAEGRARPGRSAAVRHSPRALTAAQQAKLKDIPARLRRMYRAAVTSKRRVSAIRFHCLECVAWVAKEVHRCSSPGCVLYPYRLGGYPGSDGPREAGAADPAQVGRQPLEPPIEEGVAVPLPPRQRSAVPAPEGRARPDEPDTDGDAAALGADDGGEPAEGQP
jgi:hypothetical protein